ncbi:MAG: hypothetical protein ACX94A_00290 [Algiphilus sp.]
MMKKIAVGVALAVWGSSVSAQMVGVGRVGALAGVYNFDFEFSAGGVIANESSSELSVGILTGYTVAWETFFADLALEYQTVDGDETADFDRTDILLSVGRSCLPTSVPPSATALAIRAMVSLRMISTMKPALSSASAFRASAWAVIGP